MYNLFLSFRLSIYLTLKIPPIFLSPFVYFYYWFLKSLFYAPPVLLGFRPDKQNNPLAGVRANGQQPKLYVPMVLILIFAEALGLYGLIIG